jgi:hypothetical protein
MCAPGVAAASSLVVSSLPLGLNVMPLAALVWSGSCWEGRRLGWRRLDAGSGFLVQLGVGFRTEQVMQGQIGGLSAVWFVL